MVLPGNRTVMSREGGGGRGSTVRPGAGWVRTQDGLHSARDAWPPTRPEQQGQPVDGP